MMLSKVWWKKLTQLFLLVAVTIIIVLGVYLLITMNNTITALNNRINEQQTAITSLGQATQQPTPENHDTEVSQLEILYTQKETMVNDYSEQSESIKQAYNKNKDFSDLFIIECKESVDTEKFLSNIGSMADKYKLDPIMLQSAGRAALYYKFAKHSNQILIEARGKLDLLINNFLDYNYNDIKNLLNSIKEPNH